SRVGGEVEGIQTMAPGNHVLALAGLGALCGMCSGFLQPSPLIHRSGTLAAAKSKTRSVWKRSTALCMMSQTIQAPSTLEAALEDMTKYCEDTQVAKRRPTRTVWVGKVPIGSEHRIARQTMTTTDTKDVEATVEQVIRCADAGADLVRITVQGRLEAKACQKIRDSLNEKGYDVPLVADIHFSPQVAMMVAEAFEKIRINPGNFVDGRKTFNELVYDSKEDFDKDREHIEEVFAP
ncbi:unnamed protein product, partial [Discosporangium mesarthrocarpum]